MQPAVCSPRLERFAVLIDDIAGERERVMAQVVHLITKTIYHFAGVRKGGCSIQSGLVQLLTGLLVLIVIELRAIIIAAFGKEEIVERSALRFEGYLAVQLGSVIGNAIRAGDACLVESG